VSDGGTIDRSSSCGRRRAIASSRPGSTWGTRHSRSLGARFASRGPRRAYLPPRPDQATRKMMTKLFDSGLFARQARKLEDVAA
jgi:hypothetical protein